MARIIIAAIVGGLIVFGWSSVAHMMLPIGEMGMHVEKLPGEASLRSAMTEHLPESGLYFIPGMDPLLEGDPAKQWEEAAERMASGPVVLMAVRKDGSSGMAKELGFEGLANISCALVAGLILWCIPCAFVCRVLVVMALGLFSWISIDVSYVIWYGFPVEYAAGQLIDHLIGWLLAGLVIAAIVKPCAKSTAVP